jgi:hypothetical protein
MRRLACCRAGNGAHWPTGNLKPRRPVAGEDGPIIKINEDAPVNRALLAAAAALAATASATAAEYTLMPVRCDNLPLRTASDGCG